VPMAATFFRARERKDRIVGTIAEPRKGTLWYLLLHSGLF
jgi:hypothetical protein